jgi:hypothetical protein
MLLQSIALWMKVWNVILQIQGNFAASETVSEHSSIHTTPRIAFHKPQQRFESILRNVFSSP